MMTQSDIHFLEMVKAIFDAEAFDPANRRREMPVPEEMDVDHGSLFDEDDDLSYSSDDMDAREPGDESEYEDIPEPVAQHDHAPWEENFPVFTLNMQVKPTGMEVGITVRSDDEEYIKLTMLHFKGLLGNTFPKHLAPASPDLSTSTPPQNKDVMMCPVPAHKGQRLFWNEPRREGDEGWWSHKIVAPDGSIHWCNPFSKKRNARPQMPRETPREREEHMRSKGRRAYQ